MKRLAALLSVLLLGLVARGQNVITDFTATLPGHCATFGYSYSMSGQFPLSGSGEVRLQNDSFTMKGDGLEIYCDGATRWTVDTEAEECYIESVDKDILDVEANPALLVGSVDKAFKYKKSSSATFNGQKVTEALLIPTDKTGNISEVSLFITSDKKPVGGLLSLDDGTVITIIIKDFALGAAADNRSFGLDTKKLTKNYIITDLR